ncbi:response regulator [Ekhidna sp.]
MTNSITIMLIDDNEDDNFFHSRVIKKTLDNPEIIVFEDAEKALAYFEEIKDTKNVNPDLILLDINMPGMNGWEFLEAYKRLDPSIQLASIVVMLTTSENPDDFERAKEHNITTDFKIKPLTTEMVEEMIKNHL